MSTTQKMKNIYYSLLFRLPANILNIIYDYDPTYHYKYRESMEELDCIMKHHSSHRLRKECYENLVGYVGRSFNGVMIQPLYTKPPYFLSPLQHTRSNIFRSFEIFCMKYPYTERNKKQEYIKTIKQFSHHCQLCDSTDISPSRYKLKKPFDMYLFCSYDCHKKYYENIDINCYRRYTQRPIFDKNNMSMMARCYMPNHWHLNPKNEQWEIVWKDDAHPYDRPIQKGYF